MAFTFTTAFPSYEFRYPVDPVTGANGLPVPIDGYGLLKVTFQQAQAHTDDGTASNPRIPVRVYEVETGAGSGLCRLGRVIDLV